MTQDGALEFFGCKSRGGHHSSARENWGDLSAAGGPQRGQLSRCVSSFLSYSYTNTHNATVRNRRRRLFRLSSPTTRLAACLH